MVHAEILKIQNHNSSNIDGISVDNKMKAIPLTYLGMMMTVEKMISEWVAMETKDLTPFMEGSF